MAKRLSASSLGKKLVATVVLTFFGLFVYWYTSIPSIKTWHDFGTHQDLQIQGAIYHFTENPKALLPPGIVDAPNITPQVLGMKEAFQPSEWVEIARKIEKEHPLVVFSKTYCPYSKRAKALLEKYQISPEPLIIEADLRDDTPQLTAVLRRLTGRATFPNVLLKGVSIGGSDDIHNLHSQGKLKKMLQKAGLKVRGDGVTLAAEH